MSNLKEVILDQMLSDDQLPRDKSIVKFYNNSTDRTSIDQIFMELTGWSLGTIIIAYEKSVSLEEASELRGVF
jgi:hypothetical protein